MSVYSVNVYPSSTTIKTGNWYYGAYATVNANSDCETDVEWYSNNASVATVNPTLGYIYGIAPGTARIYAQSKVDNSKKDYITVTVTSGTICVESVSLNRSSISLEKGDCFSLTATVCPTNATNKAICWRSTNTGVATVSDGIVVAKASGTAYIYAEATDGSGEYDVCYVNVTEDVLVSSVTVEPSCKTMKVGDSAYLYAVVCPENATNCCVKWSSSNSSVVSVNTESGLIYAKKAGTATIYAVATDGSGCMGQCNITVTEVIYVNNIVISEQAVTLYKDDTYTLCATVNPSNAHNPKIRWTSDYPDIATVDSVTGLVTAKAAGQVAIRATALDGSYVSEFCCVTVKQNGPKPKEDVGEAKVSESTFADPVDVYTGAHILKNTLISLFGGQGIKLVAQYDSTRLSPGVLGRGWYHNYEKHLELLEDEVRVYSTPSVYSKYTSNADNTSYVCNTPNKNGYVLTIDNSQPYPYVINCNSERTEYYDANGYLAKIVDHQGFETLITYSDSMITITDAVSGKKIYLEKDNTGKVVRVYDDNSRRATLAYSGDLLTHIIQLNGSDLFYTYNEEGQVLTGVDSKNVCFFTNTYDECGRVITQKDGIFGSIASTFVYEGNKRITTNRNGDRSIRTFDENGLLVSYADENGNTKTYEYDAHYNVCRETDANGNAVIKQYNSFNKPVEVTDRNGNKTCFSYDTAGNVVKISYPVMNGVVPEETFVYNERNQLTQHTDLRGTVTVYTYDTSGMPLSKKVGSRNAIAYSYSGGLLTSQTDAMGNTTQYAYNAIGQLTSMTDAEQNTTVYEYDACGNLLKVTDPNNQSITNVYDCNQQKVSVTDAKGYRTEYSYNGNMKNDVVTLPDNNTIRYEFDGEDRVVKTTDQAGNSTFTQYDKAGRIISKMFPLGVNIFYEYDKVGNLVKETNHKGAVIVKTYDANGNVLSVVDNGGNIVRYQYNGMGKRIRAVNAVSGTTVYTYSQAGDLLSETDATGHKKVYTYDAFGNLLTATDANGKVTTYAYDANNNLLTVRDALGNTTTNTYNSRNLLVSVKDARNNTTSYGYDALGRRTTVTDAKNNVFTTVYDANGNVLKTLDAKGNTVSEATYNCLNLPATVTDAAGKTMTYTYTALGKVATVTDSMNHRQEYTYDERGLNTSVRDANNGLSSVQYDALGNITALSGPLGGATNYSYDAMGRLVSESTVSGGTKSYEYNELNVRKKITNARGQIRQVFYDAMGRITGYVGQEDSVSYTYDANGNVLTVTDRNGTIKREYDALNRVTRYTDTYGKTVCYEYDAVGNLTRLVYPDNTSVVYGYDANNNLVSVTDWANRVTAYTYDVNNRLVGVTKPDGSVTTTVYDAKQRVVSTVEKTPGGAVISGFEYTYDTLSRVVEEKHLAEQTKLCYTYDSLNRVTSRIVKNEQDAVISRENYTYDAAGNIVDAPNSCFLYDVNNRLISFNGNMVSYDLDGNMLSNGSLTCTYDSANRLVSAGGHTYTYNAADVRIRNLCADEDTTYTYDPHAKISRLLCKTTNGVVTKYVYGRGLIGEDLGSAFKTYHFDYRGSTVAITDATGNITDTFAYDTYGKCISRTGTSNVIFGYNGRDGVVTDANGLIYMRARYYSPEMKRFINADIVTGKLSNAITLNRFAYANGNPVSFVDPFGLSAERGNSSSPTYAYGPTLPHCYPSINKTWQELGFVYDGSMRDFRRLEQGLPPYAYEVWLKQEQERQTYYSVSWKSISSSVGNDTASASGGLYVGTAYAGLMDKGLGAEAGISGATAEGNLSLGNLSLDGEANVLAAEASAEFLYEDGFKLGAEAKASVATAEAAFTIDLWLFEIEIGANADFLSAGAEANVTAGKNDEGKFEIGAEAGIGALLFGFGLDISLIFG